VPVGGIALESRRTLIVERRAAIEAADAAGLFLYGFSTAAYATEPCRTPSVDDHAGVRRAVRRPDRAELMSALRSLGGMNIRLVGVGGTAMAAQGLQSLFRSMTQPDGTARSRATYSRHSAACARGRGLCGASGRCVVTHRQSRFHPSYCAAAAAGRAGDSYCQLCGAQVWASRSWRARKMARYFDLVLALLPFERPSSPRMGFEPFSWVIP